MFPITEAEYCQLDKKFGKLAYHASWQLIRQNSQNNHINDIEDVAQEVRMAFLEAGSYYKRQTYIENCFTAAKQYITDLKVLEQVSALDYLWINRTKHGASRQKFGAIQETKLEKLVNENVPEDKRPNKNKNLSMDSKFFTYCKTIVWNKTKGMGKRISKRKQIDGNVSLSEYEAIYEDRY